jgi:Uri superfamily endonuclease
MRVSDVTHPDALPAARGTYALELFLAKRSCLQIGKLGAFDFPRGYYVYVGSARGAGGLRARLLRHWCDDKRVHWHIDYLRAVARPVRVWYSTAKRADECKWAALMQAKGACISAPRFGASDCACAAHLFYFDAARKEQTFSQNFNRILTCTCYSQGE